MQEIVHIESVVAYNAMRGVETLHPFITLLDLSDAQPMPAKTFNFSLYAIFLKELNCGELKYGRNQYDYHDGTLVFIAPGQVLGVQPGIKTFEPKGWALLFHPDLIKGTSLGKSIHNYSFFSYDVNEALHLSEKERQLIIDCFVNIKYEIQQQIDNHSRTLIASNIELLLNYCSRYYDRQFMNRNQMHKGILEQFEQILHQYFALAKAEELGLPTVAYCADALHLSPNYFGDLVKKETGKTAQAYIQSKIIDVAKERVFDTNQTLADIAYSLGFKYPQHFTRLFKQKVGLSPNQYRQLN